MLYLICLGLFLPLISFLGLVAASNWISRQITSLIACTSVFISFICFVSLLFIYIQTGMDAQTINLFKWIPVDRINADFALRFDGLSLLMALIITGIGFLIHVYSIGYMDHEKDFARYFACLNLFIFAMLLLVLAGHLLVLFVGWEGVGLASYLLIGFWYDRPSAAQAATKAFVVNRIGDLGFLLALLLTFHTFGTSDITEISQRVGQEFSIGAPILIALTLLFFWGATGKSAQLPLYNWLPDAMEGPTPVSALIHAATMVTAGVYLVVRLHPLFALAPLTLHIIGYVGGATALFAALCALAQTDLKRVLAYSTISQLGLMFLACGAGAFYAAMFHLTTHAFMKALLFLSASNVVHMMHGTTNMGQMGGLSKRFNKTHWLFLIGVLAMSGIPPLAAFFSKDLILEQEYQAGFKFLFYIGLITSLLTAFYLTRAYYLTFLGTPRNEEKLQGVQEAPSIMLLPVAVLALLSIFGGFLGASFNSPAPLEDLLAKVGLAEGTFHLSLQTWLSIGVALVGVGAAAWIYSRFTEHVSPSFLKKAFYLDEIYWRAIVLPLKAVSRFVSETFEPKVFDGMLHGIAHKTQDAARLLQHMQSGQIRSYISWIVLGTVFLIVYLVF